MEGDVRTRNLAIAKQAEIDAEKQRVNKGIIHHFRTDLIRKVMRGAGTVFSKEAKARRAIQMEGDIR